MGLTGTLFLIKDNISILKINNGVIMNINELLCITSTDTVSHPYYFVDEVFSDDQIRYLINTVEMNADRYDVGRIGGGGENGGVNNNVRRSQIAWLKPDDSSISFYYKKLIETIKEVNQSHFRFVLHGIEHTQFTKYVEEDHSFYNWHKDESTTGYKHEPTRKLSSVLFLSDPNDYEGGELQICESIDNIITIEPKKGRMVFFPSYTIHKVNPVTKGVRYTAVNWARGPAFV